MARRGVDRMLTQQSRAQLRSAAGWLGIAVALAPAFEVADRYGVITTLSSPSTFEFASMATPLGLIALFVAVGLGAAWVLGQHGRHGRWIMVGACALPLLGWMATLGLRALTVVPALALTMCVVQLRTVAEPMSAP